MDITLPQSLFTVSDLTSLAGLVVAVYVIVSFIKEPLKTLVKGDWIVRPATVVIALGILLWLIFIQGSVTPENIGLAVINSFLVALIAGAAHDYIVAPTKAKAQEQEQNTIQTYGAPIITSVKNTEDFFSKLADTAKKEPTNTI